VLFDEQFTSAIALTWQKFHDGLALCPLASFIPDITTTTKQTGTLADFQPQVVEGTLINLSDEADPDDDDCPNLTPQTADDDDSDNDDADSTSTTPSDTDADLSPTDDYIVDLLDPTPPEPEPETPQVQPIRRSTRPRKPNPKYASVATTVCWENLCDDIDLQEVCAVEAHPAEMPSLISALSWEPAPKTLREILKMPNGPIKTAWLKSVKSEFKTLVNNNTFVLDTPKKGETVTPIMETFKVKILSDDCLDKLKTRIVVRGDLQQKSLSEDKWSPTASFRALKMFLAHTSRCKARVKQLDFVGAFLQAKTRSRVFVIIPPIYGVLFPEYKAFCGKPVRLAKSMYGMTLSGKYWFLDLQDYLFELGFIASTTIPSLFMKRETNGHTIYVLHYVDDILYYGTNERSNNIRTKSTKPIQLRTDGPSSLVPLYSHKPFQQLRHRN
jgi:hypothetical protein